MPEKLIAIKGFHIPETCLQCPMLVGGWCGASPPEIDERVAETVDEAYEQKRPDWCPLVEVEPVRHGRWIEESANEYYCSYCGKYAPLEKNLRHCDCSKWCKECGTKMDGGLRMDAKKCDRCGAYYERYGSNTQANGIYIQNLTECSKCRCDRKYDLCPCCMNAVQEWLRNKNGDVNNDQS